jgi:predicted glycoside hydrolase/deacetylase ChbG (UPF0249 family)
MTQRRRTVPEGYVDEAIVEKLMQSFGHGVFNECLPTGLEIINAAGRLLTIGLHGRLTNGDPSATTPEIEAQMRKFTKQLHALLEATVAPADDADDSTDLGNLAERQYKAQMRMLHVLRELRLLDVPSIAPVVAALTASMLFRVPPEEREQVTLELARHIQSFLQTPPAGVVRDHDA